MQIQLDYRTIPEIVAITASALLGIIVLANHWRDRRGRLFGLLCLTLFVWKTFDFIYPSLSSTVWIDSVSWAAGALAISLSFHFIVAYAYFDRSEPRGLAFAPYPFAALFMAAAAMGALNESTPWKVAYTVFFLTVTACGIAFMMGAYRRDKGRKTLLALLGVLALAGGVTVQIAGILANNRGLNGQVYGTLIFEILLGYDILVAGFLREKREHLRALDVLGLREKRLEIAEARFRKLMDSSYDIIFTIDAEANILAINTDASHLLGFPVEEMLGKGYLQFLSQEDQVRAADAILRGLGGEKIRYVEFSLTRPGSKPVILSLTGTRLFDSEEERAMVIARDVTKARAMERELQARNRLLEEANRRLRELDTLKTELVGIVGHELRSPLTVIYSYSLALKDHWDKMDDDRRLECVDHVLRECNRLNRMVENVLNMSRIESERLLLNLQPGDLFGLLSEVAHDMAMTTRMRQMKVETCQSKLELNADWDKIKQVVINLLDNAVHFSPAGSLISINGDIDNTKAIVRVKDQGPGIPAGNRERLFEKFTQSKVTGMERGLGLGLYIVRTFVEAHGGEVWLEDEEGSGAIVAFSLPLQAEAV
jgi:PAS domain S-box-containing protein